ncbi:MAG: hypothetical protein ABTQ73_00315 [Caldilineales bacterium]
MQRILFWTPRLLGLLFALFLSLFALDVFGQGYSAWDTLRALLIHLTPVYAVLIVLAIAWRWEKPGGLLFFVLALLYILWTRRLDWSLVIAAPLLLLGLLFLLAGMLPKKPRGK